jgi:hypothetical protein
MTVEKKILIAPQDILSLGYECQHCHSTYLVPLDKLSRITTSCPNCKEEWVSDFASGGVHSDVSILNNFTQLLKILPTRNVGVSIRLEIREQKKEPE